MKKEPEFKLKHGGMYYRGKYYRIKAKVIKGKSK